MRRVIARWTPRVSRWWPSACLAPSSSTAPGSHRRETTIWPSSSSSPTAACGGRAPTAVPAHRTPAGRWPTGARHLRRHAGAVRPRRRARRRDRGLRRVAGRRLPASGGRRPAHGVEHGRGPDETSLFAGVEHERFYFVHSYGVRSGGCHQRPDPCPGRHLGGPRGRPVRRRRRERTAQATQFHPRSPATPAPHLLRNWVDTL